MLDIRQERPRRDTGRYSQACLTLLQAFCPSASILKALEARAIVPGTDRREGSRDMSQTHKNH
jgi:hypothetical protein